MNVDALRRVRELFDEAAELRPEQRREWWEQQDVAVEIRSQVEAQLQMLESGGRPLPDLAGTAVDSRPSTIGSYRVLRRLGEGGMGVVYAAEQTTPLRRTVAIKRVRPDLDTRSILRRFEVERRMLEQLDHPCIARVLDAGEDGSPWFAMELCDGPCITDYCDQNSLTVESRIRVFIDVCRGLQHAHQRGVLHRDLKPSNLLVVQIDGLPVPKIIDFGIAKALSGDDIGERTQVGVVLGTPAYMAPEQRAGAELVDTRSDCYALGVVLFELLVGELPRVGTGAPGASSGVTPAPRPSACVKIGTAESSRVARQRGLDARGLRRHLRGDLDRVLTTALAADLEDRYGSTGAFADDLARVLRGAPISVGPPSFAYRLRCLARQHRVAFVATVITLLALIVGGGVAVNYAIRAERSLAAARAGQFQLYDALSFAFAEARISGRHVTPGRRLGRLNLDLLEASVPGFRRRDDQILARQAANRGDIVRTRREQAQLIVGELDRLQPAARLAGADRLMVFGLAVMNLGDPLAAIPILEACEAQWSAVRTPQDLRVLASRAYLLDALCASSQGERAVRLADVWLEELRVLGFVETSVELALVRSRRGMALREIGRTSEALVELAASVEILRDSSVAAWSLQPRAVRLEEGVGDEAERRSFAALLCAVVSWGLDHLRLALGPDGRSAYEALCALERSVDAGLEADATRAFEALIEAQRSLPASEVRAALSIWIGGIGAVCVSRFGWKSDLTEAVLKAAAAGQRGLKEIAPERFAKSLQFLSGVLLAEARFDEAERVILDALSVESILPTGDSEIAPVLTPNTHWRLRGRLGACLAERGDRVAAHDHMLESWIALDRLERPGTDNANHALRELARLHREWDAPEATRCRQQMARRLRPELLAAWRKALVQ